MRADAKRNRSKILAAAASVFATQGSSASTEEVAARAGVAIGTVFRHFPTKNDLLTAIMKELLDNLVNDITALAESSTAEPGTADTSTAEASTAGTTTVEARIDQAGGCALFAFFTHLVAQASDKKAVVDLLAAAGTDIRLAETITVFEGAVGRLLRAGQRAGTIAAHVQLPEVMALLTSTSQGAVQGGWSPELQQRVLQVVFAGLSP